MITVNDTEIFVCVNDTPLLNVTFLYVSKYTEWLPGNFRPLLFLGTKVPVIVQWTIWSLDHSFLLNRVRLMNNKTTEQDT